MKKIITLLLALVAIANVASAKDYVLSTPNTSLILSAETGKTLYFRYYGSKASASEIRATGRMLRYDAYPVFGTACDRPYAALVKQHDGDNAAKMVVEKFIEEKRGGDI